MKGIINFDPSAKQGMGERNLGYDIASLHNIGAIVIIVIKVL